MGIASNAGIALIGCSPAHACGWTFDCCVHGRVDVTLLLGRKEHVDVTLLLGRKEHVDVYYFGTGEPWQAVYPYDDRRS
ncbi:hypothetical protein N7504_011795 [Penicillium tannophilum]|nr:hypothetical protein N7504_011795 [Penicillium tannophilum]